MFKIKYFLDLYGFYRQVGNGFRALDRGRAFRGVALNHADSLSLADWLRLSASHRWPALVWQTTNRLLS